MRQAAGMEPHLRRRLARLARRHHGIVTREQLEELGLTARAIDWALRTAQLTVMFPGVYRVNGAPDTWRSRALAAQLRVERQLRRREPPGAPSPLVVVGGSAAAHLHGLPGHARPPRLTVVTSQRCRSSTVTTVRRRALTDADVVMIDHIPVTSLAWSTIEAAAHPSSSRRRDLVAHVIGTGRLRPGQLLGPAYRTIELPGRGAVIRGLRELAGPVDHIRSGTEARLVDACVTAGLPPPSLNHRVLTAAGTTHELDLSWAEALLDVEVDGPHHLLPSQRRSDRARDRDLRGDDWEVLRFPVEEVDEDPADVVGRIAAVLARRTPDAGP